VPFRSANFSSMFRSGHGTERTFCWFRGGSAERFRDLVIRSQVNRSLTLPALAQQDIRNVGEGSSLMWQQQQKGGNGCGKRREGEGVSAENTFLLQVLNEVVKPVDNVFSDVRE
jgi:hypothetical protein